MVTFSPMPVPLNRLLLDPNNFRFNSPGQITTVAESRFAESSVQAAILERIKKDGVLELKQSIAENGFVPVERIVVRKYGPDADASGDQTRYVVIEGNRRTSALKLLSQDHASGVDLDSRVTEAFGAVPVLLAADATADDILAIMGIRHVGGPKEWGGYQAASLVHQLMNGEDANAKTVSSRLGLTVNEVNRRHRAFSALTQMMGDEEFSEAVTPEMYPIFHEAVGQPAVREWLGWSQTDRTFNNEDRRELFYGWLTKGDDQPKIRSYGDVRDLKQILDNEDALTALMDDDQTLSDALAIVRADAKAVRWLPNVKAALTSLNEMGSETVEALTATDIEFLSKLKSRAHRIIQTNQIASQPESDDAD